MSITGTKVLAVFLIAVMLSVYLPAASGQGNQSNAGNIEGSVFDTTALKDAKTGNAVGGTNWVPLEGVRVTITNIATNLSFYATTDASGRFRKANLVPGEYKLSFSKPDASGEETFELDLDINTQVIARVTNETGVQYSDPPRIALRTKTIIVDNKERTQTTTAPGAVITSFPSLLNRQDGSKGGSFDDKTIQSLPTPGVRTFDYFAFLLPGVFQPPQAVGSSVGPGIGPGLGTSGQFSVNGLRSRANNFTVDGSDNNDEDVGVRRQGFVILTPQSLDSIQDFTIKTALADPQYGRNLGAQANAASKLGGQDFHGSVYGFLTDSHFNARDFFNSTGGLQVSKITIDGRANGTPVQFAPITSVPTGAPIQLGPSHTQSPDPFPTGKDPFTHAQYGFVFGGPLTSGRESTHFFISYEQQAINASKQTHFAVPTVQQRGIFGSGATGSNGKFPSFIDGNAFFSLFPFPNNPTGPYGPNTYTQSLPNTGNGRVASAKIDHKIGDRSNFFISYNYTTDRNLIPTVGGALYSTLRSSVQTGDFSSTLRTDFSSHLNNNFRFSYGRTGLDFTDATQRDASGISLLPSDFDRANKLSAPFLLNRPMLVNVSQGATPVFATNLASFISGGVSPDRTELFTGPIGQLLVSGFSPVGVDVFNFPQNRQDRTLQFADTVGYQRGRSAFNFGFDIRHSQLQSLLPRNSAPVAVFDSTLALGGLKSTDPNLKTLLLGTDFVAAGAPTGFYQAQAINPNLAKIDLGYWQTGAFGMDQFRVRQNLTLTFGGRFELNTVPVDTSGNIEKSFTDPRVTQFINAELNLQSLINSRLAPGTAPTVCPNAQCLSGLDNFLANRRKIYNSDGGNFAPYFAFNYSPGGKGFMVFRGGFGVYYDQIPGSVVSQSRNVFPNFVTVNTAGLHVSGDANNPTAPGSLIILNPQRLAQLGTLNTLTTTAIQDPTSYVLSLAFPTNLSAGASFILPTINLKTPYSEQWSLSVEKQFGANLVASASYVGTRGARLLRTATPNLGPNAIPIIDCISDLVTPKTPPVTCANVTTTEQQPQFFGTVVAPFQNFVGLNNAANLQRPFPLLGSFTSIQSDSNSIYHSLQLQASRRFGSGLLFTTSYTYSHAIDQVSDIFDLAGAPALPQNSFKLSNERSDSSFDVRHRFVYSVVWNIPRLSDTKAFKGLQISSIGTFQSGQPYTLLTGIDANLDGNLTDRLNTINGLSQVNDGRVRFIPNLTNISQYIAPAGKDGIIGRNTFRAQGTAVINLAILKPFVIREHRLEVRSEFFNLFNRASFGIPVNQLLFPSFGSSVDTRVPNRQIQFSVRYSF